eukprot:scpid5542/ scgid16328/ Protein FAM208A; CTCL tumor antigen se89-1; Retinoblastoma-associated protein RAP140
MQRRGVSDILAAVAAASGNASSGSNVRRDSTGAEAPAGSIASGHSSSGVVSTSASARPRGTVRGSSTGESFAASASVVGTAAAGGGGSGRLDDDGSTDEEQGGHAAAAMAAASAGGGGSKALLESFSIPRRDVQVNTSEVKRVTSDSREARGLLRTIRSSCRDQSILQNLSFYSISLISSPELEKAYQTKRQEMRSEGYTSAEVVDAFAFVALENQSAAEEIREKGLGVGQSASSHLGDASLGVYVARHFDVCTLGLRLQQTSVQRWVLVLKFMKGRVKTVNEVAESEKSLAPTPNYDCHIARNQFKGELMTMVNHRQIYTSTQYFLYEFDEDSAIGMSTHPRQCCPHALLLCSYEGPPIGGSNFFSAATYFKAALPATDTSEVRRRPPGQAEMIAKQQPVAVASTAGDVCWCGSLLNKSKFLSDVQLVSFCSAPSPPGMQGKTLNIKSKVAFAKLRLSFPSPVFSAGLPASRRLKPEQHGTKLYHYFQMEAVNDANGHFERLKSFLLDHAWAGVVEVEDSKKFYIMPSSELTVKLGLSRPSQSSIIHCVLVETLKTAGVASKPSKPSKLSDVSVPKTSASLQQDSAGAGNGVDSHDSQGNVSGAVPALAASGLGQNTFVVSPMGGGVSDEPSITTGAGTSEPAKIYFDGSSATGFWPTPNAGSSSSQGVRPALARSTVVAISSNDSSSSPGPTGTPSSAVAVLTSSSAAAVASSLAVSSEQPLTTVSTPPAHPPALPAAAAGGDDNLPPQAALIVDNSPLPSVSSCVSKSAALAADASPDPNSPTAPPPPPPPRSSSSLGYITKKRAPVGGKRDPRLSRDATSKLDSSSRSAGGSGGADGSGGSRKWPILSTNLADLDVARLTDPQELEKTLRQVEQCTRHLQRSISKKSEVVEKTMKARTAVDDAAASNVDESPSSNSSTHANCQFSDVVPPSGPPGQSGGDTLKEAVESFDPLPSWEEFLIEGTPTVDVACTEEVEASSEALQASCYRCVLCEHSYVPVAHVREPQAAPRRRYSFQSHTKLSTLTVGDGSVQITTPAPVSAPPVAVKPVVSSAQPPVAVKPVVSSAQPPVSAVMPVQSSKKHVAQARSQTSNSSSSSTGDAASSNTGLDCVARLQSSWKELRNGNRNAFDTSRKTVLHDTASPADLDGEGFVPIDEVGPGGGGGELKRAHHHHRSKSESQRRSAAVRDSASSRGKASSSSRASASSETRRGGSSPVVSHEASKKSPATSRRSGARHRSPSPPAPPPRKRHNQSRADSSHLDKEQHRSRHKKPERHASSSSTGERRGGSHHHHRRSERGVSPDDYSVRRSASTQPYSTPPPPPPLHRSHVKHSTGAASTVHHRSKHPSRSSSTAVSSRASSRSSAKRTSRHRSPSRSPIAHRHHHSKPSASTKSSVNSPRHYVRSRSRSCSPPRKRHAPLSAQPLSGSVGSQLSLSRSSSASPLSSRPASPLDSQEPLATATPMEWSSDYFEQTPGTSDIALGQTTHAASFSREANYGTALANVQPASTACAVNADAATAGGDALSWLSEAAASWNRTAASRAGMATAMHGVLGDPPPGNVGVSTEAVSPGSFESLTPPLEFCSSPGTPEVGRSQSESPLMVGAAAAYTKAYAVSDFNFSSDSEADVLLAAEEPASQVPPPPDVLDDAQLPHWLGAVHGAPDDAHRTVADDVGPFAAAASHPLPPEMESVPPTTIAIAESRSPALQRHASSPGPVEQQRVSRNSRSLSPRRTGRSSSLDRRLREREKKRNEEAARRAKYNPYTYVPPEVAYRDRRSPSSSRHGSGSSRTRSSQQHQFESGTRSSRKRTRSNSYSDGEAPQTKRSNQPATRREDRHSRTRSPSAGGGHRYETEEDFRVKLQPLLPFLASLISSGLEEVFEDFGDTGIISARLAGRLKRDPMDGVLASMLRRRRTANEGSSNETTATSDGDQVSAQDLEDAILTQLCLLQWQLDTMQGCVMPGLT